MTEVSSGAVEVTVTDSTFTDNEAYYGGGLYVGGVYSLTVSGCTFEDNESANGQGAYVTVDSSGSGTLSDCTFDNNARRSSSTGSRSALVAYYVDVVDTSITNTTGGGLYLAYAEGSGITSAYNDNESNSGGAYLVSAEVSDSTFSYNTADKGAGVYVSGTTTLDAVSVVDNEADDYGGGLYGTGDLTLTHTWLCHNTAASYGAAGVFAGSTLEVSNSAFVENGDTATSAPWYLDGPTSTHTNNVFLGNASSGGAVIWFVDDHHDFVNNVVAYSDTASGLGDYSTDSLSITYNAFYDNDGGDGSPVTIDSDGNIDEAPDFTDYTLDGDCTNDDLTLDSASALVDTGDPSILDPDGTDSDIGLYGGEDSLLRDEDGDDDATVNPGATEAWYDGVDQDCSGGSDYDQDGDGEQAEAYGGTDCDDTDPDVYVGAADAWYDGVDSDCDGADDYDQDGDGADLVDVDGDGWAAVEAGGDDCDDSQAAIHPGAEDTPGDGIDQDCSGEDSQPEFQAPDTGEGAKDGGSCSARPGAPSTALLAGLVLLIARSRRAQQ